MEKKDILIDFERNIKNAKARALSKISLERPLTDRELNMFREAMS